VGACTVPPISKYKILFSILYSNLCKLACKGVNHKGVLFSKDCILKTKFERYFQTSFYKELFTISKDLFQTLSPYLHLCKQTSLHCSQTFIEKFSFILKTYFATGLAHYAGYRNNLGVV
jgi:hypothetical protein